MTESDALELIALYGANAITAFTVYISFTFAFLATAYFVGSRLTPAQVCIGSGLYIISATAPSLTQIIYIQGMFSIAENVPTVMDSLVLFNGGFWIWIMSIIQSAGIFVSLYFMWQVRHSDTK